MNELPRKLGTLDATAIVIGIVIGSGIFVLPNLIARNLPSVPPGAVRLSGFFGLSEFIEKASPELAANAMLCAVNQAAGVRRRSFNLKNAANASSPLRSLTS